MSEKGSPPEPRKPRRVEQPKRTPLEIKKGLLLVVKAPPYYTKEYVYEVTSAGDKLVRADLYHSPRVRKSWSREELVLLFEMGMVRVATASELPAAKAEGDNPEAH